MATETLLIALLLLFAAIYVAASMAIIGALKRRGHAVNVALLRLLMPKYAGEYRKATITETGKTGNLFYLWVVSVNLALLAAIALILTKI